VVWNDQAIGFSKACNEGIKAAKTNKIVLLNNDTLLLEQQKNAWLERLDTDDISCVLMQRSDIVHQDFAVFFCVMIHQRVFDDIGLLDERFGTGGCEDIDFCVRAREAGFYIDDVGYRGDFPIYHVAEGTMNDPTLVKDWDKKFLHSQLKLAAIYNPDWLRIKLSNNYERAVFLKNDYVFPRETFRYKWAADHLLGNKVLEIGCSTGYGRQFLPDIDYTGLDYDPIIIDVAKEQNWGGEFVNADINTYPLDQYDTIIAFEVIEHLDNGLELVERLKKHCKRLLITVPWNEPKGFWGEHHKLHGLNERHFPGFQFNYINEHGVITDQPQEIGVNNICNLMICWCDNE
jgi:SAM-dependent methyltransferase